VQIVEVRERIEEIAARPSAQSTFDFGYRLKCQLAQRWARGGQSSCSKGSGLTIFFL